MKKKIFFVGDLNIKINKKTRFIGANKKIRIILSSLIKQGYDICNINSVPQMGARRPMRIQEILFFEKAIPGFCQKFSLIYCIGIFYVISVTIFYVCKI